MPLNCLTICVSAEFSDGTSDLNAATLVQDEEDIDLDACKLAVSFANALDLHVGDPLKFLARVIQNLNGPRRGGDEFPWRDQMCDAAESAG